MRSASIRHPPAPNVPPPFTARNRRRQQQRLDEQAADRLDRRHLPQQAVAAEAERQRQRDPGHRAVDGDLVEDAGGRQHDGQPLQTSEPLAEDDDAEQHADERTDEVAEAALQNAPWATTQMKTPQLTAMAVAESVSAATRRGEVNARAIGRQLARKPFNTPRNSSDQTTRCARTCVAGTRATALK